MTFNAHLQDIISTKNSLLCVGIDPDAARMPLVLQQDTDAVFRFCSDIIASTQHVAAAYKLNFAFFEAYGSQGWRTLERLMTAMPGNVFTIADAKRADIGNSARQYAEAILKNLSFDAITVNPYMGSDSVQPFLIWPNKGAFILALTSNTGSEDFQYLQCDGIRMYMRVIEKVNSWNGQRNCGLVVGATHPDQIAEIRSHAAELPFLIPGIGSQGGSLHDAVWQGTNAQAGMVLINSSRGIIFKSAGADFAEAAAAEAEKLCLEINQIRQQKTDNG